MCTHRIKKRTVKIVAQDHSIAYRTDSNHLGIEIHAHNDLIGYTVFGWRCLNVLHNRVAVVRRHQNSTFMSIRCEGMPSNSFASQTKYWFMKEKIKFFYKWYVYLVYGLLLERCEIFYVAFLFLSLNIWMHSNIPKYEFRTCQIQLTSVYQ